MCSFIFFNFHPDDIEYINEKNQKRGPDFTNVTTKNNYFMLHNLLSITGDFAKQPFKSKESYCLFNGEVYNFSNLNRSASSDGESILYSYETDGIKFFKELDGEFSILLFDADTKMIYAATDTFATKPLWFGSKQDKYGFSSYESVLERAGLNNRFKIPANSLFVFDTENNKFIKKYKIKSFNLSQFKDDYDDWNRAFANSISKRTNNLREKVFIGLSSGYDSGAIACELKRQGIQFSAYSIEAQENTSIINSRHNFLKNSANCKLFQLTREQFETHKNIIKKHSEEFLYRINRNGIITPREFMTDDKGSVGLSFICTKAKEDGCKIYLSGQGADEIFSDYGFNGKKFYSHSTFGGNFTDDLSNLFPWNSFYEGTQYSYLGKEENISGMHGIEGRYPFLDFDVVQEFLWLKPTLKNKFYKSVLHQYLEANSFAFDMQKKIGFSCDKNLK